MFNYLSLIIITTISTISHIQQAYRIQPKWRSSFVSRERNADRPTAIINNNIIINNC